MRNYKALSILAISLVILGFFAAGVTYAQVSCANDCSVNDARQCLGNGYQICGDHDGDGCLEWSAMMVCSAGQRCQGGGCVVDECAEECVSSGARQCSGDDYQTCGNYDSDRCLEWSASASCGENKRCIAGLCSIITSSADNAYATTNTNPSTIANAPSADMSFSSAAAGAGAANTANGTVSISTYPEGNSNIGAGNNETNILTLTGLGPSGSVASANVILTVSTDKSANCRYDAFNKSYNSMSGVFSTANGLYHRQPLMLPFSGNYTYYVRCFTASGVTNSLAGIITFRYIPAAVRTSSSGDVPPQGAQSTVNKISELAASNKKSDLPTAKLNAGGLGKIAISTDSLVIYDPLPTGRVYQNQVTLTVTTNKASECRYSIIDTEFEKMESFSTGDNLLHQSITGLIDYGPYSYYVRCRSKANAIQESSTVLYFTYADPQVQYEPEAGGTADNKCTSRGVAVSDKICHFEEDCLCDPDCGVNGWPVDPDCKNIDLGQPIAKNDGISGTAVMLITGLVTLSAISSVFLISNIARRVRGIA